MSSPEPPRYRVLSHTADTAIEAWGDDLAGLVENAAAGMFSLMYDPATVSPEREFETTVSSPTESDLLVDVLAELLYRSEADDLALNAFHVVIDNKTAHVIARGGPLQDVRLHGPPIKAVTYHGLIVSPVEDGWYARLVFDV